MEKIAMGYNTPILKDGVFVGYRWVATEFPVVLGNGSRNARRVIDADDNTATRVKTKWGR